MKNKDIEKLKKLKIKLLTYATIVGLTSSMGGCNKIKNEDSNSEVGYLIESNENFYESDKAGIFYTTKFNDYRNWTNFNNLFKFQTLSVPIAIAGNAHAAFQMGWLDQTGGYSYLGILSKESGYGDQWQITYSLYQDNKIYADVRNNYSQTLSSSISCTVVYVKSDYLTAAIVGDENETE